MNQLTAHRAERITLAGTHGPVAALRSTPDGATTTVLLVPGYTGSKEDFAPLLDPIADAGFDVIAVDLPGQHESKGPENKSAYLPAALGKVVADLIAGLERPVLLLGHSYGGLVVRGAVLAGAQVAGLTLMDSGPARLPDGERMDAVLDGEPVLREQGIVAAYEFRERVSARNPGWVALPAALKDFYRARFVGSSTACLLGMAEGLRTEPDLVDELAAALRTDDVPCLVVAGEGDDAWSVGEQRSMAQRLGARFAVIANALHSPNTENPQALLEVLLPTWRRWAATDR